MRVISFLITSLVALVIVGGVGFLLTREVLLQLAISQLKTSSSQMQRIARNTGSYIQECQRKGSSGLDGAVIQAIQLRFFSSTEYQLEILCSQYTLDPILVQSYSLPAFVTKVPGGSGIKWQVEPSAVAVTLWGRTRSIGVEDEMIVEGLAPEDTGRAYSPITSCSGYGYSCCQVETSLGQGDPVAEATDCPRSCFTQCAPRPVILSLTTQPFLDQVTRTVTVQKGEEMTIGYVMDQSGLTNVSTVIDFGDGEKAQFTEVNALASHTYSCPQTLCRFVVSVQSTAENGVVSADTPISKLTVVVQ